MKKLFLILLNKYTDTKSGRMEILKIVDKGVYREYYEQTNFGNLYNAYIEFLMANDLIKRITKNKDYREIDMIRKGMHKAFD